MLSGLIWFFAYILGSLPFGVWIARTHNIDIRKHGSGNIGATNVARILGKKAGLLALFADCSKGVVSAAIADRVLASETEVAIAGLLTFLGHLFSVFLKFKGGKGVATGLGVFLYLMPMAALGSIVLFGAALGVSKYVSISSMAAAASVPALGLIFKLQAPYIWLSLIIALLIIVKHMDNIRRLLEGKEKQFLRK